MERNELTKAMRWKIAVYMSEDRKTQLDKTCKKVLVRDSFYTRYGKRILDILISLMAITVTLPINLIIGIITYFDVGMPIFFQQDRIGKDGSLFHLVKFRNMRNTRDERGELLPPSQRVTAFGKFVRKTSLDELLNFWSVLKGDMSIIGPRPLVPEYYHRFSERHVMRLAVRPGLECPPRSLNGTVWTWQEQFENDVWYVENVSFLTDCRMIWNLMRFAVDRKSAAARAVAARGIFMGYDENGEATNLDGVPKKYIDRVAAEMDGTEEAVLFFTR